MRYELFNTLMGAPDMYIYLFLFIKARAATAVKSLLYFKELFLFLLLLGPEQQLLRGPYCISRNYYYYFFRI